MMGYAGYCRFASNVSPAVYNLPYTVLANSAGLNVEYTPIYSEATIGQGWFNAAMSTHYSENAIIYRGTIDFEVEDTDELWVIMRDWALDYRAYARSVDISPDGRYEYQHRNPGDDGSGATTWLTSDRNGVWCESFSMTAAEGSNITASLGGVALERTESDLTSSYTYINNRLGLATSGHSLENLNPWPPYPVNPNANNLNPIPFWRSLAVMYFDVDYDESLPRDVSGGTQVGGSNSEAINWDYSIANNTMVLYSCRGAQGAAAILQGALDVTANVTIYAPEGVDDAFLDHSAADTALHITFSNMDHVIQIPWVQPESSEYALRGKNEVVSRSFSLKALGDGPNPSIYIGV